MVVSFFRLHIFPPLAGLITSVDAIRTRLFMLVSQIGINYRDHSLSQHTDDEASHVQAGDRIPYFLVDGKSSFDRLKAPKFHLLIFSKGNHADLCGEFERRFGQLADCQVVPIDARVSELFEKENEFSVFLRPDNHIAFISAEISLDNVAEYLNAISIKSVQIRG